MEIDKKGKVLAHEIDENGKKHRISVKSKERLN